MVEEQHRITTAILEKAVANEFSVPLSKIQITSFDVSAGSAVGDNFATVIKLVDFKYKLDGKEKSHCYIVKQVPINEFREKFIRNVRI